MKLAGTIPRLKQVVRLPAEVLLRIRLAIVMAFALSAIGLAGAVPSSGPLPQSDLDAFMKKVLARRDENWKKLQQYILDERAEFALKGPTGVPVWGDKREFTWFIREGYFIRSPLKANGVTVSEADRRKSEDEFLKRLRAREKRDAERARNKNAPAGEAVEAAQPEAGTLDSFITQVRQPEFVDSAYFMRFKFDQGRYALVGREPFEGTKQVLRVEYYPTQLFSEDEESAERRKEREAKAKAEGKVEKVDPKQAERRERGKAYGQAIERAMNKVSLVTLWIEPVSLQIVKYTFDNVNFDFLPGAWLLRVDDMKAAMLMSQPFKDKQEIWLPKNVDFTFTAMLAIGPLDARFHVDYHDYREATTSGRIKKDDGGLR